MSKTMLIRDLFASDVTRDIPPVVYFHEHSPERVANEVSEYIITGGWPDDHPHHRRVPLGIHEQYVRLLTGVVQELNKPGGADLPAAWISGFYGSGKSIFAKMLGLALDGLALPNGKSLAEALLARDQSPKAAELRDAWKALRQKVDPLAVIFDVGGAARDNEHIHSVILRQTQKKLGYCTEPLVADFELKIERDGQWDRFEQVAGEVLGKPWPQAKDHTMADEDFSAVMATLYPEKYTDPMSWLTSRAGTHARNESPQDVVKAIGDMLRFRCQDRPNATLFFVVDEVSQYVLSNRDRVDRFRAFITELGAGLQGKAWLFALGQQKLDENADDSFLVWAKGRFRSHLQVHLAVTNIRDVVHRRLLQKKPDVENQLADLFETHRPDLKLYAYGCESISPEEFVEVYPMLPGYIELLLQITSALRTRSTRAQGDDQAIRGLLQLLGELFREQKLADKEVGHLVTLDQIYEVQQTALDSDVQASMARILDKCQDDGSQLMVRAAKAVALLELIQESLPTDARLVAQCLYDRVDRGNQRTEVSEALEALRRKNLLGYSEKTGYKLQSSSAEEWDRERRDLSVGREAINELVQEGLKVLLAEPDRPRLQGRAFPWAGLFSDGRRADDVSLVSANDDAAVCVDFRFLPSKDRSSTQWVRLSAESTLKDKLLWIAGDGEQLDDVCRDLYRSRRMLDRYKARRDTMTAARKLLLTQEENRVEDLLGAVKKAMADTWMRGTMYFRGRSISPTERGSSFAVAIHDVASDVLKELFPHLIATQIHPAELIQLLQPELSGPSPKFLDGELGILEVDSGRYVPACSGVVPRRIHEYIDESGGSAGSTLLSHFAKPPYGYTSSVVKACVVGLLRGGRLTIQPEGGSEISAVRDAGVLDVFDKDRSFKRASFFPAADDDIGVQGRARICKFFETQLGHQMDREDHAIADAVSSLFPPLAGRLRGVLNKLNQLPNSPDTPKSLVSLQEALERCVASSRQTKPTVKLVKRYLDALHDGVKLLLIYDAELKDDALSSVQAAHGVLQRQVTQLEAAQLADETINDAAEEIKAQLALDKPWRDIASIKGELEVVKGIYVEQRRGLLAWQEGQLEQIRHRLKGREGFSTLTAEHSHAVLGPLTKAQTDTTAEAIAPPLSELTAPFLMRLQQAEEKANGRLDDILSQGDKPLIVKHELSARLRYRELGSEAELDALLKEIRSELLPLLDGKRRLRLV